MAQQELWAEKINIFHTHDGENISKHIKDTLTLPKYGFQVTCHTFSDDMIKSITSAVCVIILTEESLFEFKSKPTEFFNNLCPNGAPVIVLNHRPSTGMRHGEVKKMVSEKGIDCSKSKVVSIEKDNSGFKEALIRIISYADQTEPVDLPNVKKFIMHPTEVWKDSQEIVVIFKKEDNKRQKVEVKIGGKWTFETSKQTSCIYRFTPRGIIPGNYIVEILVDGDSSGKDELILNSKMELLSSLMTEMTHPVEFLCQCLNINIGNEDLDRELTDMLNSSGGNPFDLHVKNDLKIQGSKCELPTLLHFGAKFNLKIFCKELLKFPGGTLALNIKNKDGKKPFNIAAMSQASELVTKLMPIDDDNDEEISATGTSDDNYMTMSDLHLQHDRRASDIRTPAELRFSSSSNDETVTLRRNSNRRENHFSEAEVPSDHYSGGFTRRMTMMMLEDDTLDVMITHL